MLFDGPSCTGEAGAPGDRWCGFVSRSSTGSRNLFVVNVSAVLTGVEVRCDAVDPNCLLLTPSLGGDSFDPTHHGTLFQGDTLAYYDDALTPYVWRPGMAEGRRLADVMPGLDAIFCTPATRGAAVGCLTLPSPQSDPTLARATLLVGMADGPDEPLLAPIDEVIAANAADLVPRFGYGYPPVDGDHIAWTTRESASGPELLKLARAFDPASKVTVATDVHEWRLSADGSHWFWLAAIDENGTGTLQRAPFPGGHEPEDVLPNVTEYEVSPAFGGTVAARTSGAELYAIAQPLGEKAPTLLDTKVQELLSFDEAGQVAYVKHFVGTGLVDLFVARADASAACVVDSTIAVPSRSIYFSRDGKAVVWARSNAGVFEGQHTELSSCTTTPLEANVVALGWVGDQTILMLDDFDPDSGTGSLRYRRVTAAKRLAPGDAVLIAGNVDTYAIADPGKATLAYTVNGGTDADGVYVQRFGP
jgi:hypothetical protein